jgi:hypothetical protein
MTQKFNIDDTAYLTVKHTLKPNKYIKCKIYNRFNVKKLVCIEKWYKFNNIDSWELIIIPNSYKYIIETNNAETSHYSTNNVNKYLEYYNNQLLTVNEYSAKQKCEALYGGKVE